MMTKNSDRPRQPRSTVEPGEIAIIVFRCLRAHDGVAYARVFARGVIDVLADGAGQQLHARGARKALQTITIERACVIVGVCPQHVRQAHRVLQRHAGALREILQHRMRSIAKKSDTAVDPTLHRIAVAQYPEPPVPAVADNIFRAIVEVLEARHHLFIGHRLAGDRFRCIIVIGDDEVEHFPARERIVNDVAFRTRP